MDEREEHWDEAISSFQAFLERCDKTAKTVVLCHSDADGVAAGAILYRTLERLGFSPLQVLVTGKGENAYTPGTRRRVSEAAPQTLFVVDLGCKEEPVTPGVPTCFIDHHRPLGVPPEGVLISSYMWRPIPNSSLLVYRLAQAVTDVSDMDWVAAIGTLSDLGNKAPFDIIPQAKKKYTAKWLREATSLVNAARRSSSGDAETALRALLSFDSPKALCNADTDDVRRLWEYRAEVRAAFDEGKKAAPIFSKTKPVALVRVSSPCYIHPLVAQVWRTRLPKYVVIVGNEGYLPGYVAFSVRTSAGVNVLDMLGQIDLDPAEGYFGYGHDQASGGVIPVESWRKLLQELGFEGNSS